MASGCVALIKASIKGVWGCRINPASSSYRQNSLGRSAASVLKARAVLRAFKTMFSRTRTALLRASKSLNSKRCGETNMAQRISCFKSLACTCSESVSLAGAWSCIQASLMRHKKAPAVDEISKPSLMPWDSKKASQADRSHWATRKPAA